MSGIEAAVTPVERARLSGGFRRRVIAILIDWVLVTAALTAITVFGYAPSGGKIRLDQALFETTQCRSVTAVRGIELPADFKPDKGALCVSTLFGREIDRKIILSQSMPRPNGSVSTTTMHFPVTTDGRTTGLRYLDFSFGVITLLLLTLSEAFFMTTPGKLVAGLRVVARDGGRAGFGGYVIRNLFIHGPLALAGALSLVMSASVGAQYDPATGLQFSWTSTPMAAINIVLLVLMLAPVAAMIFQRPDPFYDRIAGVRIVRR